MKKVEGLYAISTILKHPLKSFLKKKILLNQLLHFLRPEQEIEVPAPAKRLRLGHLYCQEFRCVSNESKKWKDKYSF